MSTNPTAGTNYQELATAFAPGDLVAPFGASRDSCGRVVATWSAIGMVDVEYPSGTQRLPVEDLQRFTPDGGPIPPSTGYIPGGEITAPVSAGPFPNRELLVYGQLIGALRDVASSPSLHHVRECDPKLANSFAKAASFFASLHPDALVIKRASASEPELNRSLKLVRMACGCAKDLPIPPPKSESDALTLVITLVNKAAALHAQHGFPVRLASAIQKSALYWAGRNRRYKPTQGELDSGTYCCPKCPGVRLRKAVYRRARGQSELLYACPSCLFLIERRAILVRGRN